VFKGFVISAPGSGSGKTLVTLGILAYLKEQGRSFQAFKIGPDFIDPMWHAVAGGKPSVNLDLFAMGKDIRAWFEFYSKGVEFAVVEGVMGLCDGEFSTLKTASLLGLPVVLVVDAYGMAESILPLVTGFKLFAEKENLDIAVFLNRVSSERHLLRLEKALKGIPILGYLPRKESFFLPSRHLGLYLPQHLKEKFNLTLEEVVKTFSKTLNLDVLSTMHFNENSENFSSEKVVNEFTKKLSHRLKLNGISRVGIAFDDAFCFYYTHLLDSLKKCVEVEFFSPLRNEPPYREPDFLYLGGGYPELFASTLEKAEGIKEWLKRFVNQGGQVYAECGGLIYLARSLSYKGKTFKLADVLPLEVEMKGITLGYRYARVKENFGFFRKEDTLRGHEFHYTTAKELGSTKKSLRLFWEGNSFDEGYTFQKAIGTYFHFIYFGDSETKAPEVSKGEFIEKKSFSVIANRFGEELEELTEKGYGELELEVVERVIHATADVELAKTLAFSRDAISVGIKRIKEGCCIVTDVEMVKAGISRRLYPREKVVCLLPEVSEDEVKGLGVTRAEYAVEKALKTRPDAGIVAIGNAPTALLKVVSLLEARQSREVLVVGVPVGFIKALEAKLKLFNSSLPFITNLSKKGGSTVCAAIINALLKLAKKGGSGG